MALKLGLLCSAERAEARPTMRQVVRYLEGEVPLPDVVAMPGGYNGKKHDDSLRMNGTGEFEDFLHSYPAASYMDIEAASGSLLSLSSGISTEGR